MSGRYDITLKLRYFDDLFDGFRNKDTYLNTPVQYINDIRSPQLLRALKKMEIIIAIGNEDAFLENNLLLGRALDNKNIRHTLHIWPGEAHKALYWSKMVQDHL